ncbi:type II toxin-antitoxin system RelE/ParE family toxin [Streptosporangium canum]|uniref:type II toxin-antitoxin system RelE/ParE family toxin n=1 Tax=Streptosporangium canum TaxID=324952 RepID=UPI003788095E
MSDWEIFLTDEVGEFLDTLYKVDRESHKLVNQAILILERNGPAEGRPLVDTIAGSKISNMKELRPASAGRSEIRLLFVFDPWRAAILLVAGDKAGNWERWYREAIPRAERLYEIYLVDRQKEMTR